MKKSTYTDFIRQENELTKLRIQAEFGVDLNEHMNSDLNPALENIWLNNILEFERAKASSKKITVKEYLEFPVLKTCDELPDGEISDQLHELMAILFRKKIVVDTVADVDDRKMYRFITEELMEHEIEGNIPPQMIMGFIYEEFHPNHEYDVKKRAGEFLDIFEKIKEDELQFALYNSEDEVDEIRFENLKRKIMLFKNAFKEIKIENYSISSVTVTEPEAFVDFEYEIKVCAVELSIFHTLSGNGKFKLKLSDEWWAISDIEMPGVI